MRRVFPVSLLLAGPAFALDLTVSVRDATVRPLRFPAALRMVRQPISGTFTARAGVR